MQAAGYLCHENFKHLARRCALPVVPLRQALPHQVEGVRAIDLEQRSMQGGAALGSGAALGG